MTSREAHNSGAPDAIVRVGKSVAWQGNGRRALSTGLAPAYYAAHLDRVEVYYAREQLQLTVQALGEWDLPSPGQSLFCILRDGEEWDTLAQQERKQQRHNNKSSNTNSSRFFMADWVPAEESTGRARGTLILPWPKATPGAVGSRKTLAMAFGAMAPWQTSYPIVTLMEMVTVRSSIYPELACPRTKPIVPAEQPWRPVLPAEVEERFRVRQLELEKEASGK